MKLLKVEESKSLQAAQNFKDVIRTQQVKETLKEANTQLNDVEMKFETTLSKQRVIWAKAEEEALKKLKDLETEWANEKSAQDALLVPIEEERKKAHDLFQEAERVLESARAKEQAAVEAQAHGEELQELLTNKIDGLTEREQNVLERERKADLTRQSLDQERETIKNLSRDLTTKLISIHGTNSRNPS